MNMKDFDIIEPCVGGGIDPGCELGHTRMQDYRLGMVCGRCSRHTGNYSQGHYWGYCKDAGFEAQVKTKYAGKPIPFKAWVRELHFCCPDDCALENPDG
jgi:hypothetical protein